MGNNKSVFDVNILEACNNYSNIIQSMAINDIFSSDQENLKKLVVEYIHFYARHIKNNNTKFDVPIDNDDMKIIWTIHKLYPLIYYNKDDIDSKWLEDACLRQYNFALKIYPLLRNNHNIHKWIKSYTSFLKLCKKNPSKKIIPTLKQDFVWHAHMQYNNNYILDMVNFVGFILDHDDNISDAQLKKLTRETEYIRKGIEYTENDDSSCVTIVVSLSSNKNNISGRSYSTCVTHQSTF
jgi:hypothetical protein